MVLYLFSKNKYPRPRDYGDANLAPPIMYASDTGELIVIRQDVFLWAILQRFFIVKTGISKIR